MPSEALRKIKPGCKQWMESADLGEIGGGVMAGGAVFQMVRIALCYGSESWFEPAPELLWQRSCPGSHNQGAELAEARRSTMVNRRE